MAVAGEIDKAKVGIVPGNVGQRNEGPVGVPILFLGAFIKSGRWAIKLDKVELAIPRQVQEFRTSLRCYGQRGHAGDLAKRAKAAVSPIRLVIPAPSLTGENTRNAFPIQVHPLIDSIIQALGQILQTLPIQRLHLVVDSCFAVFELQRREGFLDVAIPVHSIVPGLDNRKQARIDGITGVGGILLVGIGEVGGTHQAIISSSTAGRMGEMMEHEHPLAQPVGAHLEAGAIGRERIGADGPGGGFVRSGSVLVMLAIVEDDFEEPIGPLYLALCQK